MGIVDDKVILVTGAGAGIGRASAELFAKEGARVVVTDVNGDNGEQTARAITQAGGTALAVTADVSNEADVQRAVQLAVDTYGRIDCALNNAGISLPPGDLTELTLERWNHTIATNLTSVFLCLKHEIAAMRRQGGGSIVNMSSVAGVVMFPAVPDYVASKHGVLGLTKTAANDYAKDGIRVNAICPGATDTPMMRGFIGGNADIEAAMAAMVPLGRLADPSELAEAALWLCSDKASFVTGATLLVDGGTVSR